MAARLPLIFIAASILFLPSVAAAQHGDLSDDVRFQAELNPNEFMVTGHTRMINIPDFAIGLFFDEHSSTWVEEQRNFSVGGEFVWRRGNDFELGVGIDRADLSMPDAFWNEDGDPAEEAEWSEVDLQVTSVVFSAYWFWDVTTWLTPYLGGGIGPGFLSQNITRYQARPETECEQALGDGRASEPPEECFDGDEPADDQLNVDDPITEHSIPPIVPMVNLTTGLRFNIGSHGVFKIESGIYPYLFAGMGLGAQW